MLRKIWQWLKNLYQRWFRKPDPTPPPTPKPPRPDTEYENLFFRLLEEVSQGASRGNIKGFLISSNVKEAELVAWLQRFRAQLETNPPANPTELSDRLQQLSQLGLGELSSLGGKIAEQLSPTPLNPQPPSPREREGGLSPSPSLGEGFRVRDNTPQQRKPHPDAVALFNQGVDLVNAGNIQGALECWNRALEIDPNFHYAWHNKGNAHSDLKQYQEAISCYERALEIDPKYHYAWTGKGNVHLELKQYQEAISCFNRALEIDPNFQIAWHNKGNAHNYLKQYQEAISCYERALEIEPTDHNAWNGQGNVHLKLKQYQEAISCFNRALEIEPKSHNAWNGKGLAHHDLKQYQEAISCYDRALEIDPNDHYAWYNKGNAHYYLKQYQEAILCYERALEIEPNFHYAWNNKSPAHYYLKQYLEAISCFNRALEIEPKSLNAWNGKGNTHSDLKQYQEAISCYDRALEIEPNYLDAWNGKGNTHRELKQYQEAISCYERALEIDPKSHNAWNNKGNAHRDLKQYQEAISCYQKALTLTDNKLWQAWGNWGLTLEEWQGEDAALAKWDEALQFILPQEDGEGCGILHQFKGNVYYRKGNKEYDSTKPFINPDTHWQTARNCYLEAKRLLAQPHLRVEYLKLLVDLAQVCHALAQRYPEMRQEAAEVVAEGIANLEQFLTLLSSDQDRRFWAEQFSSFARLRVDTLLHQGDTTAALLAAEHQKNLSLRWMQQNRYLTQPPTATIEQMQQLLAPNRAMIHWHVSDQSITAFILISGQPPHPHTIPHVRKLEQWVKQWKENYHDYRKKVKEQRSRGAGEQGSGEAIFPLNQHPWRVTMADELGKLGDILEIDKLLPHLQHINQLILTPHRDLHLLPLEYFFPQLEIIRLPSAYLGWERLQFPATGGEFLLSIGHPPNQTEPGTSDQLLYAELEAGFITHLYPQNYPIRDEAATKERVMEALRAVTADIFHFTGHGVHDLNNPDNSGLQMADGELLTMRDLFDKLQLPKYQLVGLSACETGIPGKQELINEFVGLTSPFLTANATYVLSTLWSVEEISTALIMMEFGRRYRAEEPATVALGNAKQWLRTATNADLAKWWQDRANDITDRHESYYTCKSNSTLAAQENPDECPYKHPYFWAGFTITGKVN